MGEPIVAREAEFAVHGSFVDVFDAYLPIELPERTLTITLQPGQSWTKATKRIYRRGQPVRLYVNDVVFVGRVKYRYGPKMVCIGRFA